MQQIGLRELRANLGRDRVPGSAHHAAAPSGGYDQLLAEHRIVPAEAGLANLLDRERRPPEPGERSMSAAALSLGHDLDGTVTYDFRIIAAASSCGLLVSSPA